MNIKILKNSIKIILFFTLLVVLLIGANKILMVKENNGGTISIRNFYNNNMDNVDVLFLGTSHTYTAINPAVLWEKQGITSYNLGTSAQPIITSYYQLKQALTISSPKVVVLDVFGTTDYIDDLKLKEEYLNINYSAMPLSQNKVELAKKQLLGDLTQKDTLDYILGYPIYHSKYAAGQLKTIDFYGEMVDSERFYKVDKNDKGFFSNVNTTPITLPKMDITETSELLIDDEEYLKLIVELCNENNIKLVFMIAPYQASKNEIKRFNSVKLFAEENDIKFINFFEKNIVNEETDFADTGHLNIYGAEKISVYMARFLKNNFKDIQNRKGEENTESYDELLNYYTHQMLALEIKKSDMSFLEVLDEYPENYIVVFSANGNYRSAILYQYFKEQIEPYGFTYKSINTNNIYMCEDDTYITVKNDHKGFEWVKDITQKEPLSIARKIGDKTPTIYLSDKAYYLMNDKISIFIYDKFFETYIDTKIIY